MPHPTPHERRTCAPRAAWNIPDLEGVDELSAHAYRAFIATARLHFKQVVGAMAGTRTHPGQVMCLHVLSVNDGASQRDVADMLHVAPPTVSKMLRAMERSGLVRRRPDEADQRLTHVHLTKAGRERSRAVGVAVAEYVNATFATLSEDERRDFVRLLERLGERISELAGPSPAAGGRAAAEGARSRRPRGEREAGR